MPTQNLYKSQETQLGPNTVEQYVGPNTEYMAAKTAEFGEAASAAINTSTVNKAEGALELGEYQREQDAMQGAEAYKRKLYEAAATQDEETFGRLYSEAQRIRTATEQGIMSPSTAQLRMSKLEKDMAYAHPQLAGQIRSAVAGISGNASQLLKMANSDPATKAMEEIFAKAIEQGRTPAEYMAYKRRESDVELLQKEITYATATRAYNTQEFEARYGTYVAQDTQVKSNQFLQQLHDSMKASGGMLPGADIRNQIIKFKDDLRRMRMQEVNELVSRNPQGIDRLRMAQLVEQDLAYLDDLAKGYLDGASYTFEHAKRMMEYQDKAFDLGQKKELAGLKAMFPPLYAQIFEKQPALLATFLTKAVAAAGAGEIHPDLPLSPGYVSANPDEAVGWSIFKSMENSPNKVALAEYMFGAAYSTFFGPSGAEVQPTGDSKMDSKTADHLISSFSALETAESRQDVAARIARNRVVTTTKIATSGNEGLLMSIRNNPQAMKDQNNKTIQELAVVLKPYIGSVTIGGGDPMRPVQFATGGAINAETVAAVDNANTILRAYSVINPAMYKDLLAIVEAQMFPKAPKEQGSAE